MSLSQRIRTMNVFVLSMLVYVGTFFPFPYEGKVGSANKRYEALFRRHVVSMQTGYKWFHLIGAPGRFGPSPPLIDPWARSLATLASQSDLTKWNGITAGELEDLRRDAPYQALVTAPYEGNLRLKNLQRIAAVDFVVADLYAQFPADGEEATFDAAPFQSPGTILRDSRRAMYDRVVFSDLHLKDQAPDLATKFTAPERGLVCTSALLASFHANFTALVSMKPHFANIQFKLTLNALPTDRRMLWTVVRDKTTRPARRHSSPPVLHLRCGCRRRLHGASPRRGMPTCGAGSARLRRRHPPGLIAGRHWGSERARLRLVALAPAPPQAGPGDDHLQ